MAGRRSKRDRISAAIQHTTVRTTYAQFARAIRFLYHEQDNRNSWVRTHAEEAFKIGVENGRKWFIGSLLDLDDDSAVSVAENSQRFLDLMESFDLIPPLFLDEEWTTFYTEELAGIEKSE